MRQDTFTLPNFFIQFLGASTSIIHRVSLFFIYALVSISDQSAFSCKPPLTFFHSLVVCQAHCLIKAS